MSSSNNDTKTTNKEGKYIATIGLEIHAELATHSKMFCGCKNDPDLEEPNINICPVCMGHPGTLPVLNREAIRKVIQIGTALNGEIAHFTEWDRKNYFYPDIPKGYQISQYKYPLVKGGELAGVKLTRIHLEEDTAQSTHDKEDSHIKDKSLVNFNRAGVPLMELVTEPVIRDGEKAMEFGQELQLLLRYLGVGAANMEKGEMRVEANISIATKEDTANGRFGTKTEVKNLNSFRSVGRAIDYEIKRQTQVIENGEKVIQETRGWDEGAQKTFSQRKKESAHDYRYFPDPDIPKLDLTELDEFNIDKIKAELPELPSDKRSRYMHNFGMTKKEADICVEESSIASYFESVISQFKEDKKKVRLAINYILTDYLGIIKKIQNEDKKSDFIGSLKLVDPFDFSKLIVMLSENKINSRAGKDILGYMVRGEKDPEKIAKDKDLIMIVDSTAIIKIVEDIVNQNPNVVVDYKNGKLSALQFLIGQGMKISKGSVSPDYLKELLLKKIG